MLLTAAWYSFVLQHASLHSIKQKKTISTENVSICKLFRIATSSAWFLQTHIYFLKACHATKTSNFHYFIRQCDNIRAMEKKDITKIIQKKLINVLQQITTSLFRTLLISNKR
jgi:hypothetical protein